LDFLIYTFQKHVDFFVHPDAKVAKTPPINWFLNLTGDIGDARQEAIVEHYLFEDHYTIDNDINIVGIVHLRTHRLVVVMLECFG